MMENIKKLIGKTIILGELIEAIEEDGLDGEYDEEVYKAVLEREEFGIWEISEEDNRIVGTVEFEVKILADHKEESYLASYIKITNVIEL